MFRRMRNAVDWHLVGDVAGSGLMMFIMLALAVLAFDCHGA